LAETRLQPDNLGQGELLTLTLPLDANYQTTKRMELLIKAIQFFRAGQS